jgi:hypothetical protein
VALFLISIFEALYISPLRSQKRDLSLRYCRAGNHTHRICSVVCGSERHKRKGQDKAKSPKSRKEIADEQFLPTTSNGSRGIRNLHCPSYSGRIDVRHADH